MSQDAKTSPTEKSFKQIEQEIIQSFIHPPITISEIEQALARYTLNYRYRGALKGRLIQRYGLKPNPVVNTSPDDTSVSDKQVMLMADYYQRATRKRDPDHKAGEIWLKWANQQQTQDEVPQEVRDEATASVKGMIDEMVKYDMCDQCRDKVRQYMARVLEQIKC